MTDLADYGLRQANRYNEQLAGMFDRVDLYQQASAGQLAQFSVYRSLNHAFPPPHWQIRIPDDIQ